MPFSKNLKYHIRKMGFNTVSLAERLGVSAGAIGFWQNGSRFPKKPETIEELIDTLNITAIDLFGNKSKSVKKIVEDELKNNLEKYISLLPLTLIPKNIKEINITKGYPTTNKQENSIDSIYIDKRLIKTGYADKELQAVIMIGDSMSPYLKHLDIAIYYSIKAPVGDNMYVINTPHGLTIKKLKFLANGSIRLISENQTYNTMGNGSYDEEFSAIDVDTLEILGLVVGRILKS